MSKEILLMVDAVSNEKDVSKEIILGAVETALAMATRKRHGGHIDVRVSIDPKTGEYETFRRWTVTEALPPIGEMDEESGLYSEGMMLLDDAKARKADAELGDHIEEPMESLAFGRIAAQTAKQVISQELRRAERAKIITMFEDKIGQLTSGLAKKVTRENVILDLGNNVEALLKRSEMLPREAVRVGDRVRAHISGLNTESRGPLVLLSRIQPEMLVELFRIEVPEIGEDIIQIMGAARDAGSRAKIAVKTNDGRIDPIGACVGMRGARVQAVSGELGGERIDIVVWDGDPVQFVINAMAPAEVASIVVDEDANTMDVAVNESQLSLAIGRGGQNVRLASQLTGWTINVMTEGEAEQKSEKESEELAKIFIDNLQVDEEIAAILVQEGFSSIEEVAYVPLQEMLQIEDFDEDIVNELRNRAKDCLLTKAIATEEKLQGSAPAQDLLDLEGMSEELAVKVAAQGVVTSEDLAELAVDDLVELTGIDSDEAAKLIMKAREPWFANENN